MTFFATFIKIPNLIESTSMVESSYRITLLTVILFLTGKKKNNNNKEKRNPIKSYDSVASSKVSVTVVWNISTPVLY